MSKIGAHSGSFTLVQAKIWSFFFLFFVLRNSLLQCSLSMRQGCNCGISPHSSPELSAPHTTLTCSSPPSPGFTVPAVAHALCRPPGQCCACSFPPSKSPGSVLHMLFPALQSPGSVLRMLSPPSNHPVQCFCVWNVSRIQRWSVTSPSTFHPLYNSGGFPFSTPYPFPAG